MKLSLNEPHIPPDKNDGPVNPVSILDTQKALFDSNSNSEYPSWVRLSSEIDLFRFVIENDMQSTNSDVKGYLQFKPFLLVNGYQSNHFTWNFFARKLWNLGFRNIYSLELNDFTNYPSQYYNLFESSINLILKSQEKFNTIILIGHSFGGVMARYYVKNREKLGDKPNISLLISLASPQHGFPKLEKHLKPILYHIFVPESVDVLSQDNGVFTVIDTIPDKNEYLQLTMLNIQGSLKHLAGRDGIFKPEPVSEMINIVVPRSHFQVHKSHTVFNHLIKFFVPNVFIYKIQLKSIEFLSQGGFDYFDKNDTPFDVFFKFNNHENEIGQRYPIEGSIEIANRKTKLKHSDIIFTGYTNLNLLTRKIKLSLYRKKHLSSELLIDGLITFEFSNEKTIVSHAKLHNKIVKCKFNIISYKLESDL